MAVRKPAEILAASRRETSLRKRQQVTDAIQRLIDDGETISFTAVARTAQVSTWLVYADGVREHITAAIQRQDRAPANARSNGQQASSASLQSDLAMAREEINALRQERDRLKEGVRQHLGQQLNQVGQRTLHERITELTEANRRLEQENAQIPTLQDRIRDLDNDLTAVRTSLRRMIRNGNQSLRVVP